LHTFNFRFASYEIFFFSEIEISGAICCDAILILMRILGIYSVLK